MWDPTRKTRYLTTADGLLTITTTDSTGVIAESTQLVALGSALVAATADTTIGNNHVLMADDALGAATADIARTGHSECNGTSAVARVSRAITLGAATPDNIADDADIPEWIDPDDHDPSNLLVATDRAWNDADVGYESDDPLGHGHWLEDE